MRNVSVKQAAFALEKSEQYVRIGLQRGILTFGSAINISGGKRWTYQIPLGALAKYMDISREELVEIINSF